MSRFVFKLCFFVLPLLAGVFLPYVKLGMFGKFMNLFWGFIYGIGLFITDFAPTGIKAPVQFAFGVVAWPLIVSWLLFWMSGKLLTIPGSTGRYVASIFLLLSLFSVVTLERSKASPFNSWPLFYNYLFVMY